MSNLHHIYMKDGAVYIDDLKVKGVREVRIESNVMDDRPTAQIELYCEFGEPSLEDITSWTKERMLMHEEWKKMMTKKAQELLDGLS